MKKTKTKPNSRKAWIALAITLIVTLATIVWVAVYSLGSPYHSPDVPHPLGEKLDYIGRIDSGCTHGFCDSSPSSTYYYGTNMGAEEVVRYFKNTTLRRPDDILTKSDPSVPMTLALYANNNENPIYVTYYTNGQAYAKKSELTTSKKHVITIVDEDYETAKASL